MTTPKTKSEAAGACFVKSVIASRAGLRSLALTMMEMAFRMADHDSYLEIAALKELTRMVRKEGM